MIAFGFTFPAGRYHATPWGRNVNEADVAWPPEPIRILRSLIATWWRKGDQARFPKAALDDLIDVLATEAPVFGLPDAIHGHIRTFMPAPRKPPGTLIFDAFFRLDSTSQLIVAWPSLTLTVDQRGLGTHLLERVGYLGRSESWAEGHIAENWDGSFNAAPRVEGASRPSGTVPTEVVLSVTPEEWAKRHRKLPEGQIAGPVARRRRQGGETIPVRLSDALAVDTSEWRSAGWSSPPPLRRLVYDRPPVGPMPRSRPRPQRRIFQQPGTPEVARFVLAGRPPPRIEDTLRIGEITRLALMSRSRSERPPLEFSGRNEEGPLRDDPAHAHAFYLPEDADADGFIDHILIFCRLGFSSEARRCLDRLTRLWLEHGSADEEGERGRKEWRVALENIEAPSNFSESRVLQGSRVWMPATPYLKSRFDKTRPRAFDQIIESYRDQIAKEWGRRFPDIPTPSVDPLTDPSSPSRFLARITSDSRPRSTLAFIRTRRGRGGPQPDTSGGFFRLTFEQSVPGPISLGWGAHYGLGMFVATASESA
jgi:CRISPR-associated protein Csb2